MGIKKRMNSRSDFRSLTLSDVEAAAQVLSQAFVNDPLCVYMLPGQETRVKTLYKFFLVYGELNIRNNRGYGVGDPLQGVAYWKSPSQENLSISVKSLGKVIPLFFTLYFAGYMRGKPITAQIDALHKKHADEPHYYLDNLGVLPAVQGQKLSSKLLRPILQMADEQKVIAYTDTVTRSNVAIYEHFGFQCVEECAVQNTGVTIWALRRSPQ
jgi:ribosomal protein S18 acetylase RimI-like enzyme